MKGREGRGGVDGGFVSLEYTRGDNKGFADLEGPGSEVGCVGLLGRGADERLADLDGVEGSWIVDLEGPGADIESAGLEGSGDSKGIASLEGPGAELSL